MKQTTSIGFVVLSIIYSTLAYTDNMTVEQAQKSVARTFPNIELSAVKPASLSSLYEIVVNGKTFYLSKDGDFMLAGKIQDRSSVPDQSRNNDFLTIEQARKYMATAFPDVEISRVKPTPLKDFYEVLGNGKIFYLSQDGSFTGTELYHLPDAVNLTRQSYNTMRLEAMNSIKEEQMLSYIPPNHKYTVNVFTDLNCAYCRKLHSQINQIMALGIRVNYLLFDNLGEDSYHKAVNVWCSEDQLKAFDSVKQGEAIQPPKDCNHPIDKNRNLARLVEVKQTPAFLLENGQLINGYRSPNVLLEEIKEAGI